MTNLKKLNNVPKAKLIYNPNAGKKRQFLPNQGGIALEDIKQLLNQYEIPVDYFPTKGPKHATILAKQATSEGYKYVIVAGGDGTIGEAVNGLVNSEITLGIIPLGSFMNVARMLAIPHDLEKAVEILKIGRTRKIDLGCVNKLGGEKLKEPYFFIESMGIGLEAQLHEQILRLENGDFKAILDVFKTFFDYYGYKAKITLDNQVISTRASMVTISNGPFAGASLPLAPQAKLNDHRLTVSIFRMSKFELFKYFLKLLREGKTKSSKVQTFQSKKVSVETRVKRLVHADARLYGTTPFEATIIPNALNVITGFPKKGESALIKRTYLEP